MNKSDLSYASIKNRDDYKNWKLEKSNKNHLNNSDKAKTLFNKCN